MWKRYKATHGAHANSGEPLGTPANKETKEWRMKAHKIFDNLWKSGKMKRQEAYKWMQINLALDSRDAHIGKFDIDTCKWLIECIEKVK